MNFIIEKIAFYTMGILGLAASYIFFNMPEEIRLILNFSDIMLNSMGILLSIGGVISLIICLSFFFTEIKEDEN